MPTTYTSNLRLALPATGELSGTWGDTVNNNISTMVDQAVGGYTTFAVTSTSQALTANNGTADQARMYTLVLTGTPGGTFSLFTAPISKTYLVYNNTNQTCTFTVATAANGTTGTGGSTVSIPSGKKVQVYTDGTNAVEQLNYISSLSVGSGAYTAGYLEVPQNSQSANYTLVLSDAGKHIFHPSSDANARTFTIPANSSVPFPVGTAVSFVNMTANVVSIAITTDTMYLGNLGTTGTRSLAQYGVATALKITSTSWIITGTALT